MKAFADEKINAIQKLKLELGRVENIARKGENAGYQHFLLFQKYFHKASFSESLTVGIVWQRVKHIKLAETQMYSFYEKKKKEDFSLDHWGMYNLEMLILVAADPTGHMMVFS